MSDAKVTFMDDGYDPVDPAPGEIPARFGFACPVHKGRTCEGLIISGGIPGLRHDPQGQNGGAPMWKWDGDKVAPTFNPSINCQNCWHGHIRKGRCVTTNGIDEPEPS